MIDIHRTKFTTGTAEDVDLYFEGDRVAVSDNHRMAYWFFRRNAADGSTLIHIDTHLDCSYFSDSDREQLRRVEPFSGAQQFAEHRYRLDGGETPAVQSGNWIPALLDVHPDLFDRVLLRCHKPAGPLVLKGLSCVKECSEEDVFSSLTDLPRACVSIDIDYYFAHIADTYTQRPTTPAPVEHFRLLLGRVRMNRHVPLFVALSPQCCGGWQNVIPFVQCMDDVLSLHLTQEIQKGLEPPAAGQATLKVARLRRNVRDE